MAMFFGDGMEESLAKKNMSARNQEFSLESLLQVLEGYKKLKIIEARTQNKHHSRFFKLFHTVAQAPVLNLCMSTALSITVSSVSSKPLLVTSPTLSCESWGPQPFDGSASELHPDGPKLHSESRVLTLTRQKFIVCESFR